MWSYNIMPIELKPELRKYRLVELKPELLFVELKAELRVKT